MAFFDERDFYKRSVAALHFGNTKVMNDKRRDKDMERVYVTNASTSERNLAFTKAVLESGDAHGTTGQLLHVDGLLDAEDLEGKEFELTFKTDKNEQLTKKVKHDTSFQPNYGQTTFIIES